MDRVIANRMKRNEKDILVQGWGLPAGSPRRGQFFYLLKTTSRPKVTPPRLMAMENCVAHIVQLDVHAIL
jgi:hypothetical protein